MSIGIDTTSLIQTPTSPDPIGQVDSPQGFPGLSALDLNAQQRRQLRAIFQNARTGGTSTEDVQNQIQAVLTPAQQQQLAQEQPAVQDSSPQSSAINGLSGTQNSATSNVQSQISAANALNQQQVKTELSTPGTGAASFSSTRGLAHHAHGGGGGASVSVMLAVSGTGNAPISDSSTTGTSAPLTSTAAVSGSSNAVSGTANTLIGQLSSDIPDYLDSFQSAFTTADRNLSTEFSGLLTELG